MNPVDEQEHQSSHADVRREYQQGELRRSALLEDPNAMFERWMQEALDASIVDATAMTLATVNDNGAPSARIVLLKGHDDQGFRWFTDCSSHKGDDLKAHPTAALLFYWRELERQIRITGPVSQLSREAAASYFASRPRDSQISAAASYQSQAIASREALEAQASAVTHEFKDQDIPLPDRWGGYVLEPNQFEFWQGREGRLHDRFVYTRSASSWEIERLQP